MDDMVGVDVAVDFSMLNFVEMGLDSNVCFC